MVYIYLYLVQARNYHLWCMGCMEVDNNTTIARGYMDANINLNLSDERIRLNFKQPRFDFYVNHSTLSQTCKIGKQASMPTFYSHICNLCHYLDLNVLLKCKIICPFLKGITFQGVSFFYYNWCSQNEVGNINILLLCSGSFGPNPKALAAEYIFKL